MPGPVSTRLSVVERRLTTIGSQIALTGAQAVADSISKQVASDGGTLSNYRGGGLISVDAKAQGASAAVVAPTSGAGQLAILEKGTKAHKIGRKGEPLAINGGYAEGPVRHPGSRGKRTWTRGVARGVPAARTAAAKTFSKVLR